MHFFPFLKEIITINDAFQKIWDKSRRKLNKTVADKGGNVYNRLTKSNRNLD